MKWLIIVPLFLLFMITLVLITKLTVLLSYYHDKDNDHLKLEFRAWLGLVKYKVDVPLIKAESDSSSFVVQDKVQKGQNEKTIRKETHKFTAEDLLNILNNAKEIVSHVIGFSNIVRNFLKKVTLKQFVWDTVIGIGDAAYTGVIAGAFWAVKGSIFGLISHYMKLRDRPKVTVTPNFQFPVSQTRLKCIFQFRIGHAMFAGFKLVKYWKGGRPDLKTKPLPEFPEDKTKTV